MKQIFNKQRILGLTAGIAILAGTMSPFVVNASPQFEGGEQPPIVHQGKFAPNPNQFAEHVSSVFGVSKDEVLKYQQEHIAFRDIFRASFLAKASGKSLTEVMQAKTYDNTWKDVAQTLGVSKEQMKATRNDIAATRMEQKLKISKQTSLDLLGQGYHPRDITVANALAQNTGKSIGDILAQKRINNSWQDVAASLGVDENTFKEDMKSIHKAMKPQGFPGQHGPHAFQQGMN
ncbi:MAG: hypothetical protein E6713_05835 [Sporomusaceae bacterium]|nr:hypothetical protein [Sporomusaceae bacterium]